MFERTEQQPEERNVFPETAFELDGVVVELLLDERTQSCEVPEHLRSKFRSPTSTFGLTHVACSVTADMGGNKPKIALRKVMPSRYVASASVAPEGAKLGEFVLDLVRAVREAAR